jgi:chemotaxis protein CheY-P-specific phosphatase CheC
MMQESTVTGVLLDLRFLNRTHSPVNVHSRINHNKREQKVSDVSLSCIMLVGSILVSHSASSLALAEMIDPHYVQST